MLILVYVLAYVCLYVFVMNSVCFISMSLQGTQSL